MPACVELFRFVVFVRSTTRVVEEGNYKLCGIYRYKRCGQGDTKLGRRLEPHVSKVAEI